MTTIGPKIAFSLLGTAGISVLSLAPASAVILVEPIVTTANQDILNTGRNPRTLGPEIEPGQVIEYGVPDAANNLRNGTGRDINSFVFKLETLSYSNPDSTPVLDNELVQWGDVNGDGKIGLSNTPGLEDIFKDITVTDNVITYSGGVIPQGTVFYNLFVTKPDLRPGTGGIIPPRPPAPADQDGPIRISSYYTAVPEPTAALSLAVFGVTAAVTLKGKKQHKSTHKVQVATK